MGPGLGGFESLVPFVSSLVHPPCLSGLYCVLLISPLNNISISRRELAYTSLVVFRTCVSRTSLLCASTHAYSAYCADISLAVTLGRPPGCPAEWIHVALPSTAPDHAITPQGISTTFSTDDNNPDIPSTPPCREKIGMIHMIHLRQLQAQIHQRLYSHASTIDRPDNAWFDDMQRQLDEWHARGQGGVNGRSQYTDHHHGAWSPSPNGLVSSEGLCLKYHLSVSLLNRPCPGNQLPDATRLIRALRSSSATMRTFKMMYRMGKITYGEW